MSPTDSQSRTGRRKQYPLVSSFNFRFRTTLHTTHYTAEHFGLADDMMGTSIYIKGGFSI
jgi:hypothetical protein